MSDSDGWAGNDIMRHALLPASDIDPDFPARSSYGGKKKIMKKKNAIKCTYIIYKR